MATAPDFDDQIRTIDCALDGRAIDALRFGEPGVWTPEPRAAGLSPADAAAVVASTASAPAWAVRVSAQGLERTFARAAAAWWWWY